MESLAAEERAELRQTNECAAETQQERERGAKVCGGGERGTGAQGLDAIRERARDGGARYKDTLGGGALSEGAREGGE